MKPLFKRSPNCEVLRDEPANQRARAPVLLWGSGPPAGAFALQGKIDIARHTSKRRPPVQDQVTSDDERVAGSVFGRCQTPFAFVQSLKGVGRRLAHFR